MSATKQPSYHAVANLGDVNPLEHGGAFVMVDRRGVYAPQLWVWEPEANVMEEKGMLYRFDIPTCRFTDEGGGLNDNPHHPNSIAWYATREKLKSVAASWGVSVRELTGLLTSSDPVQRGRGILAVARVMGLHEFDSYPEDGCGLIHQMIRKCKRQTVAAMNWKDGLA
jgi:hypothetical protein